VPDWTPEEIRTWLLRKIYPAYMEDSQGFWTFDNKPSDSPEPPITATIRECELLEALGQIEIIGKSWNIIQLAGHFGRGPWRKLVLIDQNAGLLDSLEKRRCVAHPTSRLLEHQDRPCGAGGALFYGPCK